MAPKEENEHHHHHDSQSILCSDQIRSSDLEDVTMKASTRRGRFDRQVSSPRRDRSKKRSGLARNYNVSLPDEYDIDEWALSELGKMKEGLSSLYVPELASVGFSDCSSVTTPTNPCHAHLSSCESSPYQDGAAYRLKIDVSGFGDGCDLASNGSVSRNRRSSLSSISHQDVAMDDNSTPRIKNLGSNSNPSMEEEPRPQQEKKVDIFQTDLARKRLMRHKSEKALKSQLVSTLKSCTRSLSPNPQRRRASTFDETHQPRDKQVRCESSVADDVLTGLERKREMCRLAEAQLRKRLLATFEKNHRAVFDSCSQPGTPCVSRASSPEPRRRRRSSTPDGLRFRVSPESMVDKVCIPYRKECHETAREKLRRIRRNVKKTSPNTPSSRTLKQMENRAVRMRASLDSFRLELSKTERKASSSPSVAAKAEARNDRMIIPVYDDIDDGPTWREMMAGQEKRTGSAEPSKPQEISNGKLRMKKNQHGNDKGVFLRNTVIFTHTVLLIAIVLSFYIYNNKEFRWQ